MAVVAAIAGVVLLIIAVSIFIYIRSRRGGKKPGQRGGLDTVSVGSASVGSMSVGSVGSAASGVSMGSRSAINTGTGRPF